MRFPTLLIVEGKPIFREHLHSAGIVGGCHTLLLLCLLVRLKAIKHINFPDWQIID